MIINKLDTQVTFTKAPLDKELFQSIKNTMYNKPEGGLWSSTYTSNKPYFSEWQKFCIEDYADGLNDHMTIFEIKDNTRIYQIDSYDDLKILHDNYGEKAIAYITTFDFEKMANDYDIIHMTTKGQRETRLSLPLCLYGWDVECSLIMNFNCIKEFSIVK